MEQEMLREAGVATESAVTEEWENMLEHIDKNILARRTRIIAPDTPCLTL